MADEDTSSADDEEQTDSGSDDSGSDDSGSEDESKDATPGRGEETAGGSGRQRQEVSDTSTDEQAPISGALPGPVNPPEG
ncbi:MAG: hypothetical protein ACR2HY_01750 [Acidimicrobiales bacterium]